MGGRGWAAILILAMLPGTSGASTGHDLERIERSIHALRRVLHLSESARAHTRAELESSDLQLGRAVSRLHALNQRMRQAQHRQALLRAHIASMKRRLHARLARLAAESRAAYALRRRNYWTLLLDQDHPARMRRILTYYRYVMQQEAGDITLIRGSLQTLSATEHELNGVTGELKVLAADQWHEEDILQKEHARRARALSTINHRVEGQERQLAQLHAAKRRLKRLVDRLRAQRFRPERPSRLPSGSFAAARGKLPSPIWIAGAVRDARSDPGGGLFFAVPSGTRVHAVFAGRIVYANWLRGFGLLLILEHGDGYMTIYAHAQSLYYRAGEDVVAGTVVATAGRSGGFRRPGLYFQIRRNGRPLAPLHWLRR
ncbi:MAG: murein hydrolase activator EnvC family protein [Acidiferrobacteraceae bacterium]